MDLVCRHCDKEQSPLEADVRKLYLANGGFHLVAYCHNCGKFIKNLPHSRPEVLHFGKHKGKPLTIIANEDESYLRWLLNQDIKESLKCAIQEVLDKKNADKSNLFQRT